jgi:hypothetical protein
MDLLGLVVAWLLLSMAAGIDVSPENDGRSKLE